MDGLNDFLQALKAIPNDEKRAYLKALSVCPDLLHRESCIDRFLQCDPTQAEKSARKFVDYWDKRGQVFEDAAFNPLALSQSCILSESCKMLLRMGWISPLPPDTSGRRVCLLNLSAEKGQQHIAPEDKARCIFFVLQCLSEERSAQQQGISLLVVSDEIPHTSPAASIKALDDTLQVFPIRVGSVHVIHSGGNDKQGSFFENVVPMTLKTLLNSPVDSDHDVLLEQRSHILVGMSKQAILEKLEKDGFRRENLPDVLGGEWTLDHHGAWLKVREQDERHASQSQALPVFSFPGKESTTGRAVSMEVREKIRDAWHSKLKRSRKRCRTKALQIHVAHLQEQQRRAKETTIELEKALNEARKIVSFVELHRTTHPFAGMTVEISKINPIAAPLMASLQLRASQVHGESESFLNLANIAPSTLSAAVRAERERLTFQAMAPPQAPPVVPSFPFSQPAPYAIVAHQPAFYSAPLPSFVPINLPVGSPYFLMPPEGGVPRSYRLNGHYL